MIRFALALGIVATSALAGCADDVATDDDAVAESAPKVETDTVAPAPEVETNTVAPAAGAGRPGPIPCVAAASGVCPKPSK